MSILLEALRKSEKNQRPHETPTIHTDDQSGNSTETLRTIPLALLLTAALLISGWFVWNQYHAPAGSYQPPVTLQSGEVHVVPTPEVVDQRVEAVTPEAPSIAPGPQNRTPVESYQPPEESTQGPAAAAPVPATVRNSGVTRPDLKSAASAGNDKPASKPAQISKPSETAAQEFHPGEPEPISYWELPDAVRADVPEIKFSVLVYATNPSDRFVLINGQRLAQGDTARPGLVVKEIRRDGVVFSYRLYQFLVER